jgi:predicted regulator of Ras-like GTPase activity (Roadblock/LC7/MglB family)
MQSTNRLLSGAKSTAAQRQLVQFVEANPDVTLAVITSSDGFEVATHPPAAVAQRIAAMSSSLQALSEAIAREAGRGRTRNLIIETDNGTILVLGIPNTLPRMSLAVVASGSEILGRLLWATRNCCVALEHDLKAQTS